MEKNCFEDAKRDQTSLLNVVEKKLLIWLASRMPSWLCSDHLTLLGGTAMLLAGVSYALSRENPLFLHAVNFWLLLNWFGDSLDGTLARYRNKLRPRYGFYVDHILDTFGAFFLIGGLALSGYMSERMALVMLIVYLMLSINIYLATYTLGTFQMSFWKVGPTELRLLLAAGNVILIYHPHSRIAGSTFLLYDVAALLGILGMAVTLVVSAVRHTRALYRLEKV